MRFNAFTLFLERYVKAHVYTDKPASIDALEDNIEEFIREIPAERLERAWQNMKYNVPYIFIWAFLNRNFSEVTDLMSIKYFTNIIESAIKNQH